MSSFHGRVLIAGGAGFLGSHLSTRFIRDDWQVVCVDNLSTGRLANIAHLEGHAAFHAEIIDASNLPTPPGSFDAILHFASPASPADFGRLSKEILTANSLATIRLLEIAKEKECRFLFASSSAVYGVPEVHPQHEGYHGSVDPVGPRSVYDEAKRFGESISMAYCESYNIDVRIARIFNTFGERMRIDDERAVPKLVRQAVLGLPVTVTGNGKQTRSFMYVEDLVEGVLALLNSTDRQPINLGNPEEISLLCLAETIKEIAESKSQIIFVPRPSGDPERRCPDIRKAQSVLNWNPKYKMRKGLEKMVQWFRDSSTLEVQV